MSSAVIRALASLSKSPATFHLRALSSTTAAMAPSRVVVLSSHDAFKKAIASDRPAVLDFHAVWCGPCKVISPKFEGFSGDFADLDFYSVDVDEQPEIAQECKIQAMPTFQVYKGGNLVEEFKGAYPDKLKAMIEKVAGSA